MFRTMVFPPSREYLNELSYRQLQTIAKRRHIPSNVKKEYLREAIYYSWRGDEARVEQVLDTIKAERQSRHLTNQLITSYRQYRTTAAQRSLVPSLQSLEGVNLGKDLIVSLVNNPQVQHNIGSFHPYKTMDQRYIKLEQEMRDSERLSRKVSRSHTIVDGRNNLRICHRNKGVKNKVTQTGRMKANIPVRKVQARPSEPILCDRVLRNRIYPIYSKFGQKQKSRHTDRDENVVTSSGDFVVAKSLRQTLADSVEQYGMEYHNNVQEIEPLDFSVKKVPTQSDDVRSYKHHALVMYSEVSHSEIQEDRHRAAANMENTQVFYSETYQRSAETHGYLQPYYHKKIRIERRMSEFNPDPLAYGGQYVDVNNNRYALPQVDVNNNRYALPQVDVNNNGYPQVDVNNNRYSLLQVDVNNNRYSLPQVDANNNVRTYPPAKVERPQESMGDWPDNYRHVEPRAIEEQRQQMSLDHGEVLMMRQELNCGEYLSCRQDLHIHDSGETPAYSSDVQDKVAVDMHGYVNESVTTYIMAPQSTDREKPDSTVDDGDEQRGMVYGYMTTVEPSVEEVEPMYDEVKQLQTQQTEPASDVASYPLPSFVDIFKRYCKGTQTVEENTKETSPDSIDDVEVGTVCNTGSQLAQTETECARVRETASELESMACGSPWSDVGAAVTVGEPSWDDVLGLIQEQGDMTTEMDNIQCVCCDWNGGAANLEAHIRVEHAEQIQTYTATLRCTHAVPLGVLLRARRYTTLLQCYGRLLALVVLYRDPEWVSVGVAQVSPHGSLPLVDSTLMLYNLVTGEPFTWTGPALRSNAIFHSNPTAHLRVPLSKLGLVQNSADVVLWNRELRASSPDHKSVCGHSHFDHITFDVHVQLSC